MLVNHNSIFAVFNLLFIVLPVWVQFVMIGVVPVVLLEPMVELWLTRPK